MWITSEDTGPFFGCYGDRYAETPILDQLAREGTLFDQAFAAYPVCAPARSTLITGVWANALGTGHMRSLVAIPSTIRLLPAWLKDAGYYCSNNAKEDYNFTTPPEAWHDSSRKATWRSRSPGQPFFHVVNIGVTHESSMFQPRPLRHDPDLAPRLPYHPDSDVFGRDWAQQYDNITRLDEQVGRVLADLEHDGLMDETIVFYFSDHGGVMPRSKRFLYEPGIRVPLIVRFPEKFRHMASTRPGGRDRRLVGFVDFAPTLLSLAGIRIPEYMQGQAFLGPQARGPRKYIFAARDRMGPCPDLSRAVRDGRFKYIRNYFPHLPHFQYDSYAMGIGAWRELWERYRKGMLGAAERRIFEPKPPEELYDLHEDPHELRNLATEPMRQAVLQRMRRVCDGWLKEIRDVSFIPELDMHRMSEGATPYGLGRNAARYPLERALELAWLAATADRSRLLLFERLIAGTDPIPQYWAVVGCRVLDGEARSLREALVGALRTSQSHSVRMAAAEVLCRFGDCSEALGVLERYLHSPDAWTRMHAAVTLGRLGPRAGPCRPALMRVAQDRERYPQLAASNALLAIEEGETR